MQVNLTCDHRVIYGTHAAAFLKDLAALIENDPESLSL
jgi:pyruvate dehydrogenase E2 component (dihydrolipoamide acetyltransferase)